MPTEIPNFFCNLYDAWARDRALLLSIGEARASTAVRALRDGVRDRVCAGDYDLTAARTDVASDATGWKALAHLLGIDAAFDRGHPYRTVLPPAGLRTAVAHHGLHQRYSSEDVAGALVAKGQPSGRDNQEPQVFSDAFSALARVSAEAWTKVDRVVLPLASQISRSDVRDGLLVGCAAVMRDESDLDWKPSKRHGISYYEAKVRHEAIEPRQDAIVRAAVASTCTLLLMPELCCSEALLAGWRDKLALSATDGQRLRWVFPGTGDLDSDKRAVNAGALLDAATGDVLVRQDKLFGFTLSPTQIRNWKIPLPSDHPLDEDITRGDRLTLVQTGVGWLAVLICQDLAEVTGVDDAIIEHGVTWLLAPVFSEPSKEHWWEHQKAKHYAMAAGTTTVVANSLVVATCQATDPAAASLVHGPGGTAEATTGDATKLMQFCTGSTVAAF